MTARRMPTHILTISVPLNLEANPATEECVAEVLKEVMPIIRVGTPNVTLKPTQGAET